MSNYAKANRTVQWFQDKFPGSNLKLNRNTAVVVLHTTEGTDWPSYGGGSSAPTYTGKPPMGLLGKGSWRAHFPDEKSSRALRNLAGGVETNTLNAIQVELIGTCDPSHAKKWGTRKAGKDYVYWPNATNKQLKWLGALLGDLSKRHGLQLVAPKGFKAYPGSYGKSNVRMSNSEWRNAKGIVGHQHVPENVHGDPGNLNIVKILNYAKKAAGTKAPAKTPVKKPVIPPVTKPKAKPKAKPKKKSNSQIATEVIAGKWGNGTNRTAKLKKAGYNPKTIQKLVNKKLR